MHCLITLLCQTTRRFGTLVLPPSTMPRDCPGKVVPYHCWGFLLLVFGRRLMYILSGPSCRHAPNKRCTKIFISNSCLMAHQLWKEIRNVSEPAPRHVPTCHPCLKFIFMSGTRTFVGLHCWTGLFGHQLGHDCCQSEQPPIPSATIFLLFLNATYTHSVPNHRFPTSLRCFLSTGQLIHVAPYGNAKRKACEPPMVRDCLHLWNLLEIRIV